MKNYQHEIIQLSENLPFKLLTFSSDQVKDKMIYVARHWHDAIEIIYVVRGEIERLYVEGESYEVHQGDVYIINSQKIHGISTVSDIGGPTKTLSIQIPMSYIEQYYPHIRDLSFVLPHFDSDQNEAYLELTTILNSLYQLTQEASNDQDLFLFKANIILLRIMENLIENFSIRLKKRQLTNNQNKDQKIYEIINFIEENYMNELSLDEIAAHCHLSKEYMCRFFKKYYGMSVYQYLTYIRVEHARKSLINTNQTIEEIAIKNGFGSVRSLNRGMKKYTQYSASELRKINNRQN